MLDRYDNNIIFECDRCHETLETQRQDFFEALDVLKSEGWEARNIGGVWRHYCTGCK